MKSVGLTLLGFSHTLLKPVWLSRPFTRPNHASVEGREEISRYASFNRGEISQLVASLSQNLTTIAFLRTSSGHLPNSP